MLQSCLETPRLARNNTCLISAQIASATPLGRSVCAYGFCTYDWRARQKARPSIHVGDPGRPIRGTAHIHRQTPTKHAAPPDKWRDLSSHPHS